MNELLEFRKMLIDRREILSEKLNKCLEGDYRVYIAGQIAESEIMQTHINYLIIQQRD